MDRELRVELEQYLEINWVRNFPNRVFKLYYEEKDNMIYVMCHQKRNAATKDIYFCVNAYCNTPSQHLFIDITNNIEYFIEKNVAAREAFYPRNLNRSWNQLMWGDWRLKLFAENVFTIKDRDVRYHTYIDREENIIIKHLTREVPTEVLGVVILDNKDLYSDVCDLNSSLILNLLNNKNINLMYDIQNRMFTLFGYLRYKFEMSHYKTHSNLVEINNIIDDIELRRDFRIKKYSIKQEENNVLYDTLECLKSLLLWFYLDGLTDN